MSATSIVLRFADYGADTIAAHGKAISESGATYWGWWKKLHEPSLERVFEELRPNLPLTVGLLDRDQGKFYEAECCEIVSDVTIGDIPTPEPEITPDYYRDQKHPAWLRLTAIRPLSREQFVMKFIEVPAGDATAFPVTPDHAAPVSPSRLLCGGRIETTGSSILHLSDLHFGDMHGFPLASSNDPVVAPSLLDRLAPIITTIEPAIGVVVVSGDLVTKGDSNNFPHADSFLRELVGILGLERSHVVLVPGNHDMWITDREHATADFAHEKPYRFFASAFYGHEVTEIETVWHFSTADGWEYVFCGMNSARPRTPETADYGYVGADRVEPLLQAMREIEAADPDNRYRLTFAVLHHHLLPAPMVEIPERGRRVSLTLDAGQLISLLTGAHVEFCLHGHQHLPVLGTTARAPQLAGHWGDVGPNLQVLGCGSSGGGVNVLQDEMRENTFGVYTPTEAGLQVRYWEYNARVEPSLLFETTVPRN